VGSYWREAYSIKNYNEIMVMDLRKGDEFIEKQALDWNVQGARRRGRLRQTWKMTILEEVGKCGNAWSKVKRLVGNRDRWRCFTNTLCS
jgi:hypothetical protein